MQLRHILDRILRRADAFASPLSRRQSTGKVRTIVEVVTSLQPRTSPGTTAKVTPTEENPAGLELVGGAVIGGAATTSTTAAASPTNSVDEASDDNYYHTAASSTDQSAGTTTDGPSEPPSSAAQPSQSSPTKSTSSAAQPTQPSSPASLHSEVPQVTSAPVPQTPVTQPLSNVVQGSAASQSVNANPAAASNGMSVGAIAGLAFGALFLIVTLILGFLVLYRRRKRRNEAHERLDDEKGDMSQPHSSEPVHPTAPAMAQTPAPAARSQDALNAPSLELLPVAHLDLGMSTVNNNKPAATVGSVGCASIALNDTPRTPSPNSGKRHGSQPHANDPTNPFGNHAETLNNSPLQTARGILPAPISTQKNIDAADFPLPVSGQVSPKHTNLPCESSTDTLPNSGVPRALDTISNSSLPTSGIVTTGAVGVAVSSAIVAGRGGNSPPLDNVHRVQLDFRPSMDDELEIRAGQLVRLLHEYDDGWALCTRMDRSQQGVVPRTCLSKQMVKPRPSPNGSPNIAPPSSLPQARSGQSSRGSGPNGSPQTRTPASQMTQGGGRVSSASHAQAPRPLTSNECNSLASPSVERPSLAPSAQAPRPQSPAGGPPGQRSRAMSNAPVYRPHQPGPDSQGPPPVKDEHRRRSNSQSSPVPGSVPFVAGNAPSLARKPVPGQAV